ncbi:MAG: hypothetical protein A2Y24_00800 [Clostridiales bacterium GWE2_32_10]|nr:MAG: hypothetical protein A2Y24_00800 [Clostridiales bacterium GWE2_32_10]HBY21277.1 hypothetical protein [Clostridiales bacterium]
MRSYKELFEKFIKGGDKTLKKIIFAFIVGVILMNLGNFVFDKKDQRIESTEQKEVNAKEDSTKENTIEGRLGRALSNIKGAGKTEVTLNMESTNSLNDKDGGIKGVIVVCEGANDIRVKDEIQKATQILLDLPLHKVYVIPKQS